jgi:hypothetical protein
MSDLDAMLTSKEPLDAFDRSRLVDWLRVLREDCAIFGAATEDRVRMARIRHRLGVKAGEPDPLATNPEPKP